MGNRGSKQKSNTTQQAVEAANSLGSNLDEESDPNPNSFHLICWNIDGLYPSSLDVRTKAVTDVIKTEKADIIFLQELIPSSLDQIKAIMGNDYHVVSAPVCRYFTGMLLKKSTVTLGNVEVIPYETSIMLRNLLVVYANVKGVDVKLLNSHLESIAQNSAERIKQMTKAFNEMTDADTKFNAIFGGDTNLEEEDVGKIEFPRNTHDIWEKLGSDPKTKYTYDMKYNDNRGRHEHFRHRIDRLYMRESENITPVSFNLRGLDRIPDCGRFPSDHWAVSVHFDIKRES